MELDLPGAVAREREEGSVEEEEAWVGWEGRDREQAPVGFVFVPVAGPEPLIRSEFLATT